MLTLVVPIQIVLLCLDKHIIRGWQIEKNHHPYLYLGWQIEKNRRPYLTLTLLIFNVGHCCRLYYKNIV